MTFAENAINKFYCICWLTLEQNINKTYCPREKIKILYNFFIKNITTPFSNQTIANIKW